MNTQQVERLERPGADPVILEGSAYKAQKRSKQAIYWFFTYNNYCLEQVERLERVFKILCEWYVFQEEIAPDTGTQHLQGTIKLKKRMRLSELKVHNNTIHWEQTNRIDKAIAYCTKEDSRAPDGKQWVYGIKVPKPLKLHEPRGWQLQVMDIISKEPDERSIYWFWEANGNVGKSALSKYLAAKHNALKVRGKAADIFYAVKEFQQELEILIIDIPREDSERVNYGAIEEVKNGHIFSGKFESGQYIFNPPHVIVFANQPPRLNAMSADRWKTFEIGKDLDIE